MAFDSFAYIDEVTWTEHASGVAFREEWLRPSRIHLRTVAQQAQAAGRTEPPPFGVALTDGRVPNEVQAAASAFRHKVDLLVRVRLHMDWRERDRGFDRGDGHDAPSTNAQKKASSLYGATTNAVVLPKQGVTPKRKRA
jgi:hypothetical protein